MLTIASIEEIEHLVVVDRKSIAKTSVSMPATYLGIFKEIRNLFSRLPEAQIAGLSDCSFSFLSMQGVVVNVKEEDSFLKYEVFS